MVEAVKFPDIALYEGWGKPHRLESTIQDLEIISGAMPKDLNGTWYRCGPDRQYPSLFKDDIFIDGEGMAHMFRLQDGHLDYRSRWVRNERFLLQEQARRSLFGRYRNRYTNDPSVAGKNQGTANTNAIWHGNKLLILKEDSLPIQVDPNTLDTIGEWNFGGDVKSVSLTAHPKIDLHTNELLCFSYQAQGDATKDFVFYVMDANGKVVHQMAFDMPYPGMVHDFAVTDSHIVVPFFPMMTDMNVVRDGGPYYQWHPDKPTVVAIFPRRGTADQIRWFQGPTTSAGHMMNAYNDGTKVHLDLCLYQGNCFDFFPAYDGSAYQPVPPLLSRMTFDLESGNDSYETKVIGKMACEMPKCDDRYTGKPYTYGYAICYQPPRATSQIGRFNVQTGELNLWDPGDHSTVQECQFVPRYQGAPEGDGYLLVIVNRVNEMRSDFAILDAMNFDTGPVALYRMPTRVRSTFHGSWVPQSALKTGKYEV